MPSKRKPPIAKVSSLSQVRYQALLYVQDHSHLPDHVKDLAKESVIRHFQALSQELGALELAVRRTQQTKEITA